MDDYKKYKLKKWLDKSLDKFFAFLFYIPRKLYKENVKFKKWIDNRHSKGYNKKEMRRLLSKIFRDIDEYGQCKVLLFTDYEMDMPWDRHGWDYKVLAESDEWIKKNKLEVERLSFYEYIEKYYPDQLEKFKWHGWCDKKEERTLVIRRISR